MLSQLTVTTEKLRGKKDGTKFEKSTKTDSIEFREQNKKKSNKNKQTNKQKRQNGNHILNQQIAKM